MLEAVDHLIQLAQAIAAFTRLVTVPVQVNPHPFQAQCMETLHLLLVLLGGKPEEVRIDAEEVFPDHRAGGFQLGGFGFGRLTQVDQ